jgi:excinuclease ABC subunit A
MKNLTENIEVLGACAHNLKNIDVSFPIGKISVVCGPSGCGKSSLVLNVLHAESRRRYLETLGSSAVFMLGGPRHVPVKAIHNLRPSIALECGDKIIRKNATVSSLAEIAPMLKILFAECGIPVCPECGADMSSLTPQQMVEKLSNIKTGTKFQILAPIKNISPLREMAKIYLAQGFVKAISDGKAISLDTLSKNMEDQIPQEFYIVIDRLIAKENQRTRLSEAVDSALRVSENLVSIDFENEKLFLSTIPRCETHGSVEPVKEQSRWQCYSWLSMNSKTLQELNNEFPPLLQQVPKRLKTTLSDIPIRLSTLCELGLGHLSLGRAAETLSGGEAQRVRLSALATGHLNGILLCLDEPASGLHEKDVEKLWKLLLQLKSRGNTLVLIEHHPMVIERADYLIEMGPGAGEFGGEICLNQNSQNLQNLQNNSQLSTLNSQLKISNVCIHNLKNIDVSIPVGAMTVICGVSGSGKSSLLWGSIEPLVSFALGKTTEKPSVDCGVLENMLGIDAILPARTGRAFAQRRSSVATVVDVMQIFRNLFASLPESKIRGYSAAKFGTDKPGGRCETCKGDGFLLDPSGYEESECPICLGKRYRDEVLEVRFKLMSIADVLDLSILKALEIFANFENLTSKLKPLADTGLQYLRLGQHTTHLSGGELQRLRLAQDLAKAKLPRTLYLFDEPARGLAGKDTALLLDLLKGLTAKGHTVIAIEHNNMFRNCADYILELEDGIMISGSKTMP